MKGKGWLLIGLLALFLLFRWVSGLDMNQVIAMGNSNPDLHEKPVWLSETIPVDLPVHLETITSGGSITIETHDRDMVCIDVFVRHNGQYFELGEEAPVEVTINERNGRITVTSEVTKSRGFFRTRPAATISYRILVPDETEVQARTSGGPVTASGNLYHTSLITSGGPVTAEGINGDLLARTSGGPITIQDVHGEVTARTSGGGIFLTKVSGTINARTSGGPVNLSDVSGSINAHTSGGPINANILSLFDGVELKTSGGPIHVYLPPDQGMDIHARAINIRNNLDDFAGTTERSVVDGEVKGGGFPVQLRTSGGTIELNYGDHTVSSR